MESFREKLTDWQDWDVAAHALAVALGLVDPSVKLYVDAKHVYWTTNPVGDALHETLNLFVKAGFIERRDEPDIQFRWHAEFRGSWEPKAPD